MKINLNKKYYFPIILFIAVLLLTAFKISGTSVGYYHQFLYGTSAKDPDLLYGKPLSLRSDEWLVNTPMVVAQKNSGLQRINKQVGSGEDVSVIIDVPSKDWTSLFRPQNWSFFILPLEYAFAFRWWVMSYILVMAAYFFVLKLLPDKPVLAILFSACLFFSPFLHWWYQSITFLPIAYTLLALVLTFGIIDRAKEKKLAIGQGLALIYVLFAFLLVLYPPWQIACLWVALGIAAGYVLSARPDKQATKRIAVVAIGVLVAFAGLSASFYLTHQSAISAVTHTIYPGSRVIASGGYSLPQLLSGYHNLQLESAIRAGHYGTNQSEASNFIVLMPLLLLPCFYILVDDYRHKRQTDWLLVSSLGVALLFLANLFLPMPAIFGKITLLDKVEHPRLLIGIGLLNFIFVVLLAKRLLSKKPVIKFPAWLVYATGILATVCVWAVFWQAKHAHPGYIDSNLKIGLISLWFGILIFTLLKKRVVLALSMLLIFSMVSTYRINPLYRGLGVLANSDLSRYFTSTKSTATPGHGWAVYNIYPLNDFPESQGNAAISGVYTYPQMSLWQQLDPNKKSQDIYNRYAHVFFRPTSNDNAFNLLQADAFTLDFKPCEPFMQNHVDYILSSEPLNDSCLVYQKSFQYPAIKLFVYKRI
jgi:hypothetical protein